MLLSAADLAALNAANIKVDDLDFRPVMQTTESLYEIRARGFDGEISPNSKLDFENTRVCDETGIFRCFSSERRYP